MDQGSGTDTGQHRALPPVQHPSRYHQVLTTGATIIATGKWTAQCNKTHSENKRQVEINFCTEASLKPNDLHFNATAVHLNISGNENILHKRV